MKLGGEGYTPQAVSNRAIDYQISTFTTISDAQAYVHEHEGHEFYVITFPTAGRTFAYDSTTDTWHERQSYISGQYTRHISNCHASCYGKSIVGDYQSGKLYYYNATNYTENDVAIRRIIVTHPFYKEGKQMTCPRLQLEFETAVGSSPEFDLAVSKDGGHTFSTKSPTKNLGSTTDYGKRIYWDQLGLARQWSFKLTTTMTSRFVLLGAIARFNIGSH